MSTIYRRFSVLAACAGVAVVLGGGIGLVLLRHGRKASRGTIRSVPPTSAHPTALPTQQAQVQVRVVYASESGNAESLAKGMVRTLRQRGVAAVLIDPATWAHLQEYIFHSATTTLLPPPPSSPPKSAVPEADHTGCAIYIFILATTGAGEPPTNFMTLYHELERAVTRSGAELTSPPPSKSTSAALPFAHVHYAVFGLGDSAYKNYCRCAVLTKSFLKKGGATELYRIGFGDASKGNEEEVFEAWQTEVLRALKTHCGVSVAPLELCGQPPTPQLQLRFLSADEAAALTQPLVPFRATADSATWPTAQHPTAMRLIRRDRLTPNRTDDGSAVYRITLETACAYQGGDHLGIYATNPASVVARAAGLLGLSAAQLRCPVVLQERRADGNEAAGASTLPELLATNVLPACVSLVVVLERYVDLCGRPKRATLQVLATYCTSAAERAEFDALLARKTSSGRGQGQSHEGGTGAALPTLRTVLDYLEHFPSCRCIGLGHLLEILPRLRPRYYSIASDALVQPHQVEILVRGVVDGLASSFLCTRLAADGREVVYGFVRSSSFHLPMQRPGRPLLLIGPGTGIAGIVGLCYRREILLRHRRGVTWGPCVCFFGARNRSEEYFVAAELERWALAPTDLAAWDHSHPDARISEAARRVASTELLPCPVISLLDCAFSREPGMQGPRYVTHLIEKHADYLYTLLTSEADGGPMVFVSGEASRMAKDVDRALAAVLQEKGNMSRLAAVEFLQRMEHEQRYLKDVY